MSNLSKAEQEKAIAAFKADSAGFDGDNSLALGRASMCYGTPEEEKLYGPVGAKRGVLIDVLEKRALASTRIVPLYGWEDRCFWPKDAKAPVYVYKFADYHKIPAEHLVDGTDAAGKYLPPLASKRYNWVCMVEGEQFPYLFTFKRTSMKAGEFIRTMEARRASRKMGSALYALGLEDAQSQDGKAYKRLVASVVGDVPPAMIADVSLLRSGLSAIKAKAETMAAEAGDVDADEIPI